MPGRCGSTSRMDNTTFTIESVVQFPGVGELPSVFIVKVSVTVRDDQHGRADAAYFTVQLPFDEHATYATIRTDALQAVQRLVDSIQGMQQTNS